MNEKYKFKYTICYRVLNSLNTGNVDVYATDKQDAIKKFRASFPYEQMLAVRNSAGENLGVFLWPTL